MKIIFQDNGNYLNEWMQALKHSLPQAEVRVWREGDNEAADYAIVWKPLAAMLDGRTDLKAIFSRGAGVDGILLSGAFLPDQVPVVRLTDAGMGVQMAEYVTHAVLRYFRQFDLYAEDSAQKLWRPNMTRKREDFRIGVLGTGVLGTKIIKSLQTFEFPINAWSRSAKQMDGVQCFAGAEGLDEFLASSKVLVCILPLTDDTRGILNHQNLSKLPQSSYVINVARGAHVVEEDLLALVRSGHIAGATLDVFQQEPLPADHAFWQEKRITITPHVAAVTMIDESAEQIAVKIAALERGEAVAGVVDRLRGY